jgi:hypothetical protein
MLERIHIHQLFTGTMDHHTRGPLVGIRAPDGKVWIKEGGEDFLPMRRAYSKGRGPEFTKFMANNPEGKVQVDVVAGVMNYQGRRSPASFSVKSFVVWVDYDSFARKLIVYECERKAFETLPEVKLRLLEDSVRVGEVDMQISPNYLLSSVDSGALFGTPFNIKEELEA